MAGAPAGAVRKRVRETPFTEEDFPTLERKRERNLFVFGRGDDNNGPKFLVVEREEADKSMKTLSVFKVKREIAKIAGTVKRLQPLLGGKTLLIEIKNENQVEPLLKLQLLAGKAVKVSVHQTMNKSKGIIACYDWTHMPIEELKEELKAFNISDVTAIKRKAEKGKMIDTGSFIVVFDSPQLPESIDAFYYPLKVRVYVPNPMRCFKCQKYGHFVDKCRLLKKLCGRCLYDEHEGECKNPHFCANCGEDHLSWSRKCPIFKQEFAIMRIKVTQKMSYFAAKQEYMRSRGLDKSFAEVVARSKASKMLRQIQASKKTVFPGYEAQRNEGDERNGVGLPSTEFLESLRQDRMDTEENSSADTQQGHPQTPGVSSGNTFLGADNSTGSSPQLPSSGIIGTVIKDALDILN